MKKAERREFGPIEVILIQYSYLSFDSEGRIDAAEMEKQASLAVDIVPPLRKERKTGQVINAHYRFAKKRYDYEYKWAPSPQIRAAIGKAIYAILQAGEKTKRPWK